MADHEAYSAALEPVIMSK